MPPTAQSATLSGLKSHHRRLARTGWYLAAAIALGLFVLSVTAQLIAAAPALHALDVASFWARTAAALIAFTLAGVLFGKRPDEGMALFLSFFLLAHGVVMGGLLAALEPFWPGAQALSYQVVQPLLYAPLLVAILATFPDGRFVPPQTRWLVVASLLFAPLSPLLVSAPASFGPVNLYTVSALVWLALIFAALYAQILRYRHVSGPAARQQTKWVVYGFTLALLVAMIPTGLTLWLERLPPGTTLPAWTPLIRPGWALATAILPVCLTLAVMRYRLFDIDVLFNRTLVYGGLTAGVIVIYALSVGVLSFVFQTQATPVTALLATGLVAVLFHPLRDRLQAVVNRLFYGQRDDPLGALSKLARRLEAAMAPEIVLPTLVQTIAQTLKLPYVAISLRRGNEFVIAARTGDEAANPLKLPLIYRGDTVGQLIAGPRGPGESFSPADQQLLTNIAHQAGVSAYAVQLTRELRHSRLRLITAREEERRRLRRDLHDGLGPVLASQGLKIAAVAQLLEDDPLQAQVLLEELAAQNEATVAEIRRLVYELRPAALDDLGLVGAVRDYASGLRGGPQDSRRVRVEVQAQAATLTGLPAAIEVAAYRIATEALTNIARHARARQARVSLAVMADNRGRRLHLEIVDDGIGLPAAHRAGIGLISMRERAEEVGGRFHLGSTPGRGTREVADLPLGEAG